MTTNFSLPKEFWGRLMTIAMIVIGASLLTAQLFDSCSSSRLLKEHVESPKHPGVLLEGEVEERVDEVHNDLDEVSARVNALRDRVNELEGRVADPEIE